ncbi:MAG: MBL fold metallo-hydrolase [Bacteroidaceae bacterium]|nr:MBL fold metallo-hydrolase [Bacteroidaceae bacterium]
MKITILGTGTSCGVPVIGCNCRVCTSSNPKDRRLRAAIMVETRGARILIDCGPDFREQMIRHFRGVSFAGELGGAAGIYNTTDFPDSSESGTTSRIDAVFISHIHYDHCGGIDDLRPFCVFGNIHIYSNRRVIEAMHHTMPYLFEADKYPGIPSITATAFGDHDTIRVKDIDVHTFVVNHGKLPISAFRIGNFAYITDMKTINQEEMTFLDGVETLVLNALRFKPDHKTHLLIDEAIDFARKTTAKRVLFTHMCHDVGLHDEVNKILPTGFELAYDGQTIHLGKWS